MQINLRYLGQIKRAAGVPQESLEVAANCSLTSVLTTLATQREPLRTFLLNEAGVRRPTLLVTLGEKMLNATDDPPLHDGDTLTLMTPMAGG